MPCDQLTLSPRGRRVPATTCHHYHLGWKMFLVPSLQLPRWDKDGSHACLPAMLICLVLVVALYSRKLPTPCYLPFLCVICILPVVPFIPCIIFFPTVGDQGDGGILSLPWGRGKEDAYKGVIPMHVLVPQGTCPYYHTVLCCWPAPACLPPLPAHMPALPQVLPATLLLLPAIRGRMGESYAITTRTTPPSPPPYLCLCQPFFTFCATVPAVPDLAFNPTFSY